MKNLLIFLLSLISTLSFSQNITVVAPISTPGVALFPTHYDSLQKGGYRVAADVTERNAITTLRRKLGMQVHTLSDGKTYELFDATLGNSDWREIQVGGLLHSVAGYGLANVNDSTLRVDSSVIETRARTVNGLALKQNALSGTGFVTISGTTISYDNTTYSDISHTHTFGSLTSKPTTIAGYGITDFQTLGDALWSALGHTHTFASLTSKPTTIAGYGITDFNSLGDARWSLLAHTHTFASLTSKPTTISGYGITDALTGGSISSSDWSSIFSTTTATTPSNTLTFAPSLASQSAFTVFGRASGSGTPSFIALDSTFLSGMHTQSYYDTRYFPLSGYTYTNATGNAIDINAANLTTGRMINLDMTGTAAASNLKKGLVITSVGANANSSQTVTAGDFSVTNTGTTNTNLALKLTASGGTNNYALTATGRVGIGTGAPSHQLSIVPQYTNDGIRLVGNGSPAIYVGSDFSTKYATYQWDSTNDRLRIKTTSDAFPILVSGSYLQFDGPTSIGGASPSASSQFHVQSTTLGSIPAPKMTATQRNAIASPASGLLVFDTDSLDVFEYTGAAWRSIRIRTPVATAATASSLAARDGDANLTANSFIKRYATTATAAGTTTLVVGSTQLQYFTGSTTQTVVLPVTSTLALGQQYTIVNNSTGSITVQSSGANTIKILAGGTRGSFTVVSTSGTGTSSWDYDYVTPGSSRIVAASMVQTTNPSPTTLSDVTTVTLTVPANSIGVNGSLHFIVDWGRPNNADLAVTGKIKISGTTLAQITLAANNAFYRSYTTINNRNSLTVQESGPVTNSNLSFNIATTTAVATYAYDTGTDLTITLTLANGTSGTASTVESVQVIAFY